MKEFVDIAASPEEVAQRLTMIGLEVEGTEAAGGEPVLEMNSAPHRTVFEVNVTPNRPDCLSVLGIARELSASFNSSLKIPRHEIPGQLPVSEFSVEILNPDLCNRYTGRVITGVKIADSPDWLKSRLDKCGIRSINNVVDITNYVLLEFGHPLHAFDADLLKGEKIIVSTPESFRSRKLVTPQTSLMTKIKTLDGINREIPDDSLLIWDAERPVAVAGVMGGSATEVTERTGNIFLESAYFFPASVRSTSKRLGLKSESSYRFERGTDIEFLEKALDRAALLIQEIAGGKIHQIVDEYPVKYVAEPVRVKAEKINRILGIQLSENEMLEILRRLSIPAEKKTDILIVYPPAYRRDMKRDCDVAEEVARIYGYQNIPTTVPRSPLPSGRLDYRAAHIQRIREAMRKSGFTEVINFSFMSASGLNLIGISSSDDRRKTISINNPLGQDECLLRTTLAPALIGNLKYNLDRGMEDIRIFEKAKVFADRGATLPSEELRLGGVLYRGKSPSLWKEETGGFFLAKGAIESLFTELKIRDCVFSPSSEPFLQPGKASDIYVMNSRLGYLGILAPDIVEKLDLKKQRPEIVLFELNLGLFLACVPDSIRYSPTPKYPSVERDIAIVLDETIPSSHIQEVIRTFGTDLIEQVSVFDYFKGGAIPRGKKSLAFNIVYRSKDRTLTDEEVEKLHNSLVSYVLEKTGGELRS